MIVVRAWKRGISAPLAVGAPHDPAARGVTQARMLKWPSPWDQNDEQEVTWNRKEQGTLHAGEQHVRKPGSLRKNGEHKDQCTWRTGRREVAFLVNVRSSVHIWLLCRKPWEAYSVGHTASCFETIIQTIKWGKHWRRDSMGARDLWRGHVNSPCDRGFAPEYNIGSKWQSLDSIPSLSWMHCTEPHEYHVLTIPGTAKSIPWGLLRKTLQCCVEEGLSKEWQVWALPEWSSERKDSIPTVWHFPPYGLQTRTCGVSSPRLSWEHYAKVGLSEPQLPQSLRRRHSFDIQYCLGRQRVLGKFGNQHLPRILASNGFRDVDDGAAVKTLCCKILHEFKNINWLECHSFYPHISKVNEFYSTDNLNYKIIKLLFR